MSDWIAGLAGGFSGLSQTAQQILARKDALAKQAEEQARWEAEQKRMAEQFDKNLGYQKDILLETRTEHGRAQTRWEQEQAAQVRQNRIKNMLDSLTRSGVGPVNPDEFFDGQQISQVGRQVPTQSMGSGMSSTMDSLNSALRGAGQLRAGPALEAAAASARKGNLPSAVAQTPFGEAIVENKQFDPYRSSISTQGRMAEENSFRQAWNSMEARANDAYRSMMATYNAELGTYKQSYSAAEVSALTTQAQKRAQEVKDNIMREGMAQLRALYPTLTARYEQHLSPGGAGGPAAELREIFKGAAPPAARPQPGSLGVSPAQALQPLFQPSPRR
jgi:hypothetical protein